MNNNDAAFYRLIDCDRKTVIYNDPNNANIKIKGLAGADGKTYLNDYGWK
jgi:hypothetical protein